MKRSWGLAALLAFGCGGHSGEPVGPGIVGKWTPTSIGDLSGTAACPGQTLANNRCTTGEYWIFRSDGTSTRNDLSHFPLGYRYSVDGDRIMLDDGRSGVFSYTLLGDELTIAPWNISGMYPGIRSWTFTRSR